MPEKETYSRENNNVKEHMYEKENYSAENNNEKARMA